jgi:predicted lactoylglutathione lyase
VNYAPIVVSLPIADRRTSHDFYRNALGLETIGEPGDDGIPEPLQFVVNDGLRLLMPPSDGFGFTIGEGRVAARGHHECLLVIGTATAEQADSVIEHALSAGAAIVTAPADQPWGYAGAFADPDGHIWMVRAEAPRATSAPPS